MNTTLPLCKRISLLFLFSKMDRTSSQLDLIAVESCGSIKSSSIFSRWYNSLVRKAVINLLMFFLSFGSRSTPKLMAVSTAVRVTFEPGSRSIVSCTFAASEKGIVKGKRVKFNSGGAVAMLTECDV